MNTLFCTKCNSFDGIQIARSKEFPRKQADGVAFCSCGSFIRYSYLVGEDKFKLRDLRRK